jgi:hypothetical protein
MIKTGISYFGVRNPKHVATDIDDMKSHGVTFVVHTFSENDHQYYLETMKEIVTITREKGMEVYLDPWGVGRVFGGEAYSRFVMFNRRARQILSDGIEAPAACPNHPQFVSYMEEWIEAVHYTGANGIFWDEPHFFRPWEIPERRDTWSCKCDICRGLFYREFGYEMPEDENGDVRSFKRMSLKKFLFHLSKYSKEKGLSNILCLLPDLERDLEWEEFFSIEHIDTVGTDPYWRHIKEGDFEDYIGKFSQLVHRLSNKYGKEGQIWIQAFDIKGGEEWKIEEAIKIAYRCGIRNFAAWSYWGTGYMSYIKSDNPDLVWEVIGKVYTKLQREGNL